MMRQVAAWIVRAYPRAWRARYEDEICALLADVQVTPMIVLDLLYGAVREQVRSLVAPAAPPVSMDSELLRGWRRAAAATLAIGVTATFIANALSRRQILDDDHGWILRLGMIYASFRTLVVYIRYGRLQSRATIGYVPAPSPEQMIAVGITPAEFWICILLILVGTSAYWTTPVGHSFETWMRWLSLFLYLNLLQGSARASLARRQWLVQRAIAARQSKGMA
jgi:hypothetical protein